ncbi:MAG: RluA family pseudouridine synthase [Myxococcota bacterium]|jgi:23S rRNA pseudouridine1911/1915/1917 synthase|nr:RluA family pseudouridine synthase [Myxococcota bacterium]
MAPSSRTPSPLPTPTPPAGDNGTLTFEVAEAAAGQRVDVYLSESAEVSRAQARRWLEEGRALVNDAVVRPSRKVSEGDVVVADPPEAQPVDLVAEDIPLVVLHEDADLIVIDKPAGMVVHPAPGHASGTLVNALLHHCDDLAGVGGALRPGIVHRLDRGTSGVMVAAKNDRAHQMLAEQFHDHTIGRVYRTFVRALPKSDRGEIDAPIGRHPKDRKRMSIRTQSGRVATTRWVCRARYPRSGVSQLEIHPQTGRTHQIRVHLSSHGMPIVGDPVYGRGRTQGGKSSAPESLDRPALHAALLAFDHPASGERMEFSAGFPEDLAALEENLEAREAQAAAR